MLLLAVVVLVAGIWWAIVMPQHYGPMPGEGLPIHEDDTGTRIVLALVSAVVAAALATVAFMLDGSDDKN
jgi:hypothetical protein